jgi:hypothetical protein
LAASKQFFPSEADAVSDWRCIDHLSLVHAGNDLTLA